MTNANASKWLLYGFIATALLQLGFMGRIILQSEHTLREGKVYRFRCAPVDPNDAMRGKYIQLSFKDVEVTPSYGEAWAPGQTAYAYFYVDHDGYAVLSSLYGKPQSDDIPYLKVRIRHFDSENQRATVSFPFERYYLPEDKAPKVEKLYNETLRQTDKKVYAVVRVPLGKAPVLEAVEIEGKPIEAWGAEDNYSSPSQDL
jgi:uncharacterized membrane-anchored protein